MISINRYSLSMIDLKDSAIISSQPVDEISFHESSFILRKIKKVFTNNDNRDCTLNESSKYLEHFEHYKNNRNLYELADILSQDIFNKKIELGINASSDILLIDFIKDDHNYLLIYDHSLENAFSHYIEQTSGEAQIRITRNKNGLSGRIKKSDSYLVWDYTDNNYMICDSLDLEVKEDVGKTVFELIFDIGAKPNDKDIIQTLEKSVTQIAKQHELDQIECSVALKKELLASPDLVLSDVSNLVFPNNEQAKSDFTSLSNEHEIPKELTINQSVLKKKDKFQKIVTDIGIVINIPIEQLSESDKVEIVNNNDGTVSIKINNITMLPE